MLPALPGHEVGVELAELSPLVNARILVPEPKPTEHTTWRTRLSTRVVVRSLVRPHSWFWVNGERGEIVLPLSWGDNLPSRIALVKEPAAAQLAIAYFDALWGVGRPLERTAGEALWEPLLHQMRGGVSLEQAARRLGINPRTARRRLAVAMDYFGVETMFGLAASWGAEVTSGQMPEFGLTVLPASP